MRTFVRLAGGGPVPPLGLLYLASSVRERLGGQVEVRVVDTGLSGEDGVVRMLEAWDPDIVGFGAMSCEADLLAALAARARDLRPDRLVLAGGPHETIHGSRLLEAVPSLDAVVVGEGERSLPDLVAARVAGQDIHGIPGTCVRTSAGVVEGGPAAPIEDLDALPLPAWDLVDLAAYARHPNWNGALREPAYALLATSRGCPYGCTFCHNLFGKRVRLRAAERVFDEIETLHRTLGVREFHMVDDVFNLDRDRVRAICGRIIDSGLRLSFAFPNGLRADLLTDELVDVLRRAGTYKVNFGFETTSQRLQVAIGKHLDVPAAQRAIDRTARSGIITGAYFMMGFPTETREEIAATVDYAVRSRLDMAYFFKATPYPGSPFWREVRARHPDAADDALADLHFFSVNRSYGDIGTDELNALILRAQQRFYLRPGRLWRGFWKSPRKGEWFRNLFGVLTTLVVSYMFRTLRRPAGGRSG